MRGTYTDTVRRQTQDAPWRVATPPLTYHQREARRGMGVMLLLIGSMWAIVAVAELCR
jgi:hypothetical protein